VKSIQSDHFITYFISSAVAAETKTGYYFCSFLSLSPSRKAQKDPIGQIRQNVSLFEVFQPSRQVSDVIHKSLEAVQKSSVGQKKSRNDDLQLKKSNLIQSGVD